MKTNLIFKRQETREGISQVVTKIVPVDIPFINSGEGWMLSGHTDIIEVSTDSSIKVEQKQTDVVKSDVSKFTSDVVGTAKLVRSKGVIKIVARKGKSTHNQTTPNSVCINDFTKNEFFKNCREVHGESSGIFEFRYSTDGRPYDYWNGVIDCEYKRQKDNYINNLNK